MSEISEHKFQWFVVHSTSGHEKKVVQKITEQAKKENITDLFAEILVPTEGVLEVRKGQKVNVERKFLPGYILIKMVMNEKTWHLVKSIPKVSAFLGANNKPQAISESEAQNILKQIVEGSVPGKNTINFEIGESVKVTDGPFESFVGNVEDIDVEKQRLKVSVSIFGRATPMELEYTQVVKV
jgi:transcriptional antiterminator NusG